MIANFKKKQKSNTSDSFFSSPFVKIFFIIIIGFLIFADIKVYKERKKLNLQIESLKEKIQSIQKKNDTLEQGIAKADDKDYIEKIAREELDLQIENEKVVTFVTPEVKQKEEINNSNTNFFNFKIWLGWIGNGWQWIMDKF
ncbi:MAG: septum formation initiator family protein [Candidatus Staskawiczbacteria bacterium]|nr:septum formation initiator family protein [Candidatus Staskawiczbacteria bacterium]MBI3337540.1 septum formation initiator family protein [Candidatus Staskawiczbacteria bacterium]